MTVFLSNSSTQKLLRGSSGDGIVIWRWDPEAFPPTSPQIPPPTTEVIAIENKISLVVDHHSDESKSPTKKLKKITSAAKKKITSAANMLTEFII